MQTRCFFFISAKTRWEGQVNKQWLVWGDESLLIEFFVFAVNNKQSNGDGAYLEGLLFTIVSAKTVWPVEDEGK